MLPLLVVGTDPTASTPCGEKLQDIPRESPSDELPTLLPPQSCVSIGKSLGRIVGPERAAKDEVGITKARSPCRSLDPDQSGRAEWSI
jgi:hypothetical protein